MEDCFSKDIPPVPIGAGIPAFAPRMRTGTYALGTPRVFSGGRLSLEYVSGVRIPNESGVLTLTNRPFLALYSFGAHTSNSITSARVTPVVDGEAREEYSLCCARMPSGLLASASGAAPLDGARTLAFELQTDIPARFDNSAFTVLLLYG